MGKTRRVYGFGGLGIDIDKVDHFRKVRHSDGFPGIEFTFFSGAYETAWYDYTSDRDSDFDWLCNNI